ncbi:MAG: hypothetical protein JXQ82_06300 [Methanomicrobiaceae archaeon]|nr:hypothetical protein [Methanomicrobiaceae archaeon]
MQISENFDDETAAKIKAAAKKLGINEADWVKIACEEYLGASKSGKTEEIIENLRKENLRLKQDVETQKELRDTYTKLISEKDQRIDDMKESISRIEAISITTTDQIASSKDERIKDLTKMIEHLQAQAAAHSAALQSALKPSLGDGSKKKGSDKNDIDMVEKPKWKFWR